MKRCPQCGREYDLSMSFCLDDGAELLYGPGAGESSTAILEAADLGGDASTGSQLYTTDRTAIFPSTISEGANKNAHSNRAAGSASGTSHEALNSIAILPFTNFSADP